MKDREAVTCNGRAVFYASMWNDLRQKALDYGWTLALHGSLNSDMDIIAIAWVKDAISGDELMEKLKELFTDSSHITISKYRQERERITYTINIYSDFYLDINVIKSNAE